MTIVCIRCPHQEHSSTHAHMHAYVYVYLYSYVCVYIYIYIYIYPCTLTAFRSHIYIHIHTYIHTPPQFEAPLPPLQPAVFPPALREPPPPALDLFDLDDHFASERVRLAKLTNKCSDEHLDFYITQSAEILGITEKLPEGRRGAKHCLEVRGRGGSSVCVCVCV
jgi:hypothetical protein